MVADRGRHHGRFRRSTLARCISLPIVCFLRWSIAAAAYRVGDARRGASPSLRRTLRSAGFIDRHASAIAIVFAAAAAGVGVAFGTYVAAAASDPSGYISQARLITRATSSWLCRSRRVWTGHEPESSFAPLGYRPGPHAAEIVPTYPPGLPLTMAMALVVGGENGPFFVGPLLRRAELSLAPTGWRRDSTAAPPA